MASLLQSFFKEIRSNLLYDIAKLVVLAAISMIVAGGVFLYRWAGGLPRDPILITIIFVTSFVLMTIAFFLAKYGRRRESPQSTQGTPEPGPNLVALQPQIVLVGQDSDETIYRCGLNQEVVIGGAAVAFIKNQVDDKPITRAENVRAHISYSEITGPRKTEINNALWLGSRHRLKTFDVGDTEHLILAIKPPEGSVYAVESNYVTRAGERVYAPLHPELHGKIYIVTVRLVGGEHGEVNRTFKYRLETKPDLYIEKIDESEAASEIEQLRAQIVAINGELATAKNDTENANKRANYETSQRDEFINRYNEVSRKLADLEWLRLMAENQVKHMSEHIKVTAITELYKLMIGKAPRRVTVTLRIRNESVFDVAIIKPMTGCLYYRTVALSEPAHLLIDRDHPLIEDLKPSEEALLTIEQPIRQTEAETINEFMEDTDTRFWLGNLRIPISITPDFSDGKPHTLIMNSEIEHVHPKDFGKPTIASADNVFQAMADSDRADVSQSVFVAVRGVQFGLLMSENRLDFMFEIFNGSLFPVSISARSNGFVHHNGKHLSQNTVFDPSQSDDLERGKRTVATLRHEKIALETCSELQADFDAGKPIQFDFEGLTLPVRITDPSGTGKPSRLQLPEAITYQKGAPIGRVVKLGMTASSTSNASVK